MNTEGDYRQFIQDAMAKDSVIFTDSDQVPGRDWRDVAVNKGLLHSDSEWVWFTEQDFTPLDGFWDEVERNQQMHYDAFGAAVETRLHPCCIFAKRSLIDSTSKNFGVVADKLDHFGLFQSEIQNYTHIDPKTYHHMNGLSQNLHMLQHGEEPNYLPSEFKEYCRKCLEMNSTHPDFKELFEWYLSK